MHSEAFWCILKPSDAFWSLLKHSEAFWSLLKHSEAVWCILKHSEAFWSILKPVKANPLLLPPPPPPWQFSWKVWIFWIFGIFVWNAFENQKKVYFLIAFFWTFHRVYWFFDKIVECPEEFSICLVFVMHSEAFWCNLKHSESASAGSEQIMVDLLLNSNRK